MACVFDSQIMAGARVVSFRFPTRVSEVCRDLADFALAKGLPPTVESDSVEFRPSRSTIDRGLVKSGKFEMC